MGPGLPVLRPQELMVTAMVGGQPVCFLVDTGAEHSVLQAPLGSVSNRKIAVQGATGTIQEYPFLGIWVKRECLDPATLLPDPDLTTPVHDCQELLETAETGRPDLQDAPLEKADATVFTDCSSFLEQGVRKAGVAITTETDTVWALDPPAGISAQKAELIALTQALRWGKNKRMNIYTGSRYAFATPDVPDHPVYSPEEEKQPSDLQARSDNGPAFISSIAQSVSKALNIQWKLQCPYRPQSSGQVERMNQTLKSTVTKLILEAGSGHHPAARPGAPCNPVPDLTGTCHPFRPGDLVYVKKFQEEGLTPAWKGPYTVILTTPTALKVDGIPAWIHHSCIKKTSKHQEETWVSQPGSGALKLRLTRVTPPS
ncbi:Gag-Pol polyprotein [Plecturocebus cupreus]